MLAAVREHMHELVGERERQIARAIGEPYGIGKLAARRGIFETDRLRIVRGSVKRVFDKENRGLRDRDFAQQLA